MAKGLRNTRAGWRESCESGDGVKWLRAFRPDLVRAVEEEYEQEVYQRALRLEYGGDPADDEPEG